VHDEVGFPGFTCHSVRDIQRVAIFKQRRGNINQVVAKTSGFPLKGAVWNQRRKRQKKKLLKIRLSVFRMRVHLPDAHSRVAHRDPC
jgi:hypothetical protein